MPVIGGTCYWRYMYNYMGYILNRYNHQLYLPLGKMTGCMDILCLALFGEATLHSRGRLFSNKATVKVKGDDG